MADEFLGLTPEESAYLDLRTMLSDALREARRAQRLAQVELASRLGSSQSRIAKAEAADESVSLGLMIRALLALGVSLPDLARVINGRALAPAV